MDQTSLSKPFAIEACRKASIITIIQLILIITKGFDAGYLGEVYRSI